MDRTGAAGQRQDWNGGVPVVLVTLTAIGSAALAVVAIAALVVAAQARDQTRMLRHQQCIQDAGALTNSGSSPGAYVVALSKCFSNPSVVLSNASPIAVPGVVTENLDQALADLHKQGLRGVLVSGPSDASSFVTDQEPGAGVTVPPGTVVELGTRAS